MINNVISAKHSERVASRLGNTADLQDCGCTQSVRYYLAAIVGGALAFCTIGCMAAVIAGSFEPAAIPRHRSVQVQADSMAVVNRVTWGINETTMQQVKTLGLNAYLTRQLHPERATLPSAVQDQIAAMAIAQSPLDQLMFKMETEHLAADALSDSEQKKAAQLAYRQNMGKLARQAVDRMLLRALYSSNQLQENMTWFWINHFSIFQYKDDVAVRLGDYEERALRAHALGKFRDLLWATVRHPAMLRYLDNALNAISHVNENYAREIMELHTLGVNGGYTQKDVQELTRILTGVGINLGRETPRMPENLRTQYVRDGLFEFDPSRHDYGDKHFLGARIKGRGLAEVDEAISRLAGHPKTAHFVSRKLATYFVQDDPPAALVERMASTFMDTDGDIADTLAVMFSSTEFAVSLGRKFKDPMHYVLSSLRFAYGDKPISDPGQVLYLLDRMGESPYSRQTPDGYPAVQSAWASPGQMTTRFEIANLLGYSSGNLFKAESGRPKGPAPLPRLSNALYFTSLERRLSPATAGALQQASSPQEWNMLLLASPEFMYY